MKKTYQSPAIELEAYAPQGMIAGSIKGIDGDSGLELGGDDTEGLNADVKVLNW